VPEKQDTTGINTNTESIQKQVLTRFWYLWDKRYQNMGL